MNRLPSLNFWWEARPKALPPEAKTYVTPALLYDFDSWSELDKQGGGRLKFKCTTQYKFVRFDFLLGSESYGPQWRCLFAVFLKLLGIGEIYDTYDELVGKQLKLVAPPEHIKTLPAMCEFLGVELFGGDETFEVVE